MPVFERAPEFGIQRTPAEREADRALIDQAAKPVVIVNVVCPAAKDTEPAKPAEPPLRNKGGRRESYDFRGLLALLEEREANGQFVWFENEAALEEWIANNLRQADGNLRTNPLDSRTIPRAIKRHKLARFIKRA